MSLIGVNWSDSLLSARFKGLVWKSEIPDPTTGGKKWKRRSPISFDGDYPWIRLKISARQRVGFVVTERKNFRCWGRICCLSFLIPESYRFLHFAMKCTEVEE